MMTDTGLVDARTTLISVTDRWQRQGYRSQVLEEALSLLPLVDSSLLRSGAGSPAEIGQLRQQCENLRVAVEHIRGLGHGDTLTAASSRFLDAIAAELDR
ncbi:MULTISPECIES: hypothetical protein [Mycobacterium avium complex (MAC)]|uniref:Uncharacterized protein n=1 Tax=Mycobacterium intracellulare subsp. chimaera TaxID=222805 RepID=A0ABT7P3J5_MYCIT|nr:MULTISPECIES: hypothetical protein [Mycobacterium avium complex (MAC)]AOS94755.1 hypothetical protein AN480_27040 [Mycobacterium intracellulare subsp. chimaera]MDM3927837.1 hypothetical protein [Mycobacterium intracellulare subsp. chimaera]PBA69143.1 hypothetical protein CKJ76_24270 [Mycobacterium avium]